MAVAAIEESVWSVEKGVCVVISGISDDLFIL